MMKSKTNLNPYVYHEGSCGQRAFCGNCDEQNSLRNILAVELYKCRDILDHGPGAKQTTTPVKKQ